MARGRPIHCRVEVDFALSDVRFLSMPEPCQITYLRLWALCVKHRREILPWAASGVLSEGQWVADRLGIDVRSMRHRVGVMQRSSLVSIAESAWLLVPGPRRKHARLHGWDSPYGDATGPLPSPYGALGRGRGRGMINNPPDPPKGGRPVSRNRKRKKQPANPDWNGHHVIALWIETWRELRTEKPILSDADKGHASRLAAAVPDRDRMTRILREYLLDGEDWLVRQGHPLRLLMGRINGYATDAPTKDGKAWAKWGLEDADGSGGEATPF